MPLRNGDYDKHGTLKQLLNGPFSLDNNQWPEDSTSMTGTMTNHKQEKMHANGQETVGEEQEILGKGENQQES